MVKKRFVSCSIVCFDQFDGTSKRRFASLLASNFEIISLLLIKYYIIYIYQKSSKLGQSRMVSSLKGESASSVADLESGMDV